MKIQRVNIGAIIKEKVKEKGLNKSQFAELLNIKRQNIDKTVFEKHSLDTDLLCNISEILECNLFDYYLAIEGCNNMDYKGKQEVKAMLTIEMGQEKQNKVFRFVFGENDIEIKGK